MSLRIFNRTAGILVVVGLMVVLGLVAFVQMEFARDRQGAELRLQGELEAQAQLAEAAVMERVQKIGTTLLFLRDSVETHGRDEFARVLASLQDTGLLDLSSSVFLTDKDGTVHLADGLPQPLSIAGRDYFQQLVEVQDDFHISDPFIGRMSQRQTIVLARPLRDDHDGFAGIVAIAVEPQALLGSGLAARSSNNEILTLMSDQGVVLARSREHELFIGRRIDDAAVATLRAADASYSVRPSPTDGRLRAHALRRVSGLPLYVAVGDTFDGIEAQLAPRRQALLISTTTVAALALLSLWLAWGYAQRRTAQIRDLAGLKTQLELAQQVAGTGSWMWDVEKDRINASRQVYEIIGPLAKGLAPRLASFLKIVPEAEHPAIVDALRTLLKSGRIEHEHHILRPDGEPRLLMHKAWVTETNDDGRAVTVIGSCRDITEERRIQSLLEARKQRLDTLIESLAEGVVVRDRDGRITLVNDAAARMAGSTREALVGQYPESATLEMVDEHGEVLAPDDHPAALTIRSGRPIDRQLYGIRLTGARLNWVSVSTRLLPPDEHGNGDAVVVTLADVTRLRDAEREGRMAAAVFAQVSQPIVITDGESHILRTNRAFTEAFGYSFEEAVGKKISLLRSMRHDRAFYADIWQQLERSGYWHGEIWNRAKSGEPIPLLASITRINEPVSRETRYVAVYADLHDQKAAEEALRWQANHDPLTGLPNRQLLIDRLETAISHAERKKARVAVAFIDLDRFKPVNDLHGHLAGDFVLQTIADRMRGVLRASDTLARVGGDEFVAVLDDVLDRPGIRRALAALLAAVAEPIDWENERFEVGCSIGVALWPDDGDGAENLIEIADTAMYRAKAEGRGRIAFSGETATTACSPD